MTRYYQCYMEKDLGDGRHEIKVGWIPERGAKANALIEIKGEDGLWRVKCVTTGAFEQSKLLEKQNFDRNSLLSIKE